MKIRLDEFSIYLTYDCTVMDQSERLYMKVDGPKEF